MYIWATMVVRAGCEGILSEELICAVTYAQYADSLTMARQHLVTVFRVFLAFFLTNFSLFV